MLLGVRGEEKGVGGGGLPGWGVGLVWKGVGDIVVSCAWMYKRAFLSTG